MIMGSFRLREPGDRDYAKRRRQMTRQINTFTTRAVTAAKRVAAAWFSLP